MRTLLFLLFSAVACCGQSSVAWAPWNAQQPVGGTASFTARNTYNGTPYDHTALFSSASITNMAFKFTTGASGYTVTRIKVAMYKVGSPTWTMTCAVYTDNSGLPGTLVGTASSSINSSTVTATDNATAAANETQFDNINAAVSPSTSYWGVVIVNTTSPPNGGDGANYLMCVYQNNGSGTPQLMAARGSAGWTDPTISGFLMPWISVVYSTP